MKITIPLPKNISSMTIKELLEEQWLIPRKVRHLLRTRKNVSLNGEVAMFHQVVHGGDTITLTFDPTDYPLPNILFGNSQKVDVLWEDEHLLIVNKPTGMKTHPNQPDEHDTLFNHVAAYLKEKDQIPYVVHRLDKETSGAILFAKNPVILPILGRLLEKKAISRQYEAKIEGHLNQTTLTINKNIARHRHDKRKRVTSDNQGNHAVTHVTKLKDASTNQTWVQCELETGRTHQIRVHLSSIGHPIIGDPLYHPHPVGPRLMLHAAALSFTHPFTNEYITVQAKPFLNTE